MKKLILLELTFLFLATTFSSSPPPGWYQQTLPVNGSIQDIFFLDSLKGWLVMNNGYILHTANGGDNWEVQIDSAGNLYSVQFLDSETGYALGNGLHGIIYKTTNSGVNWNLIHDFNPAGAFRDMSFVNKDTGWVCSDDSFDGGVFKTVNGGQSWQQQINLVIGNPLKIFFINNNTGWIGNDFRQLYKTSNGGTNWNLQYSFNDNTIKDIFFVNKDTGWISESNQNRIQFTSTGGNNWVTQFLPPEGGIILTSRPNGLSSVDSTTVWCVGGTAFFGMGRFRGIIYKSTDSGNNWFYQLPDTSINIPGYFNIQFVNDSIGWASNMGIIHTTKAGGPLVKINSTNSQVPKNFTINQNYPNPFNPKTTISYQLTFSSYINLKVYDIQGKEIITLVNQRQNAGDYKVEFDGSNLPSGVYLYKLEVYNEKSKQVFSETKKMLLLK